MREGVRSGKTRVGSVHATFLTGSSSSSLPELEPQDQHRLLTEALGHLFVVAQESHCSPRTVTHVEMLHKGVEFNNIKGLDSKCPFAHGQASCPRVLLSIALLTRSAVLAFSVVDKDKGRIPEILVSWPCQMRPSGT